MKGKRNMKTVIRKKQVREREKDGNVPCFFSMQAIMELYNFLPSVALSKVFFVISPKHCYVMHLHKLR